MSRISSIIPHVGGFLTGIHFTPNVNGYLHDLVFRRMNALNAQLNAPPQPKRNMNKKKERKENNTVLKTNQKN